MEIVALYTSPETLPTALAAGARHLAAIVEGFALVYRPESDTTEPDGWAGFTCARDAQAAGEHLAEFRKRIAIAEAPILIQAPDAPPRIWARAAGGVYGFALRHCGGLRGVAMVGCPGPWPRIRKAEIDSILGQLGLVLDHCAARESSPAAEEPPDEVLQMSEQLFAQDIELIKKSERIDHVEQLHDDLIDKTSQELRTPINGILSASSPCSRPSTRASATRRARRSGRRSMTATASSERFRPCRICGAPSGTASTSR